MQRACTAEAAGVGTKSVGNCEQGTNGTAHVTSWQPRRRSSTHQRRERATRTPPGRVHAAVQRGLLRSRRSDVTLSVCCEWRATAAGARADADRTRRACRRVSARGRRGAPASAPPACCEWRAFAVGARAGSTCNRSTCIQNQTSRLGGYFRVLLTLALHLLRVNLLTRQCHSLCPLRCEAPRLPALIVHMKTS